LPSADSFNLENDINDMPPNIASAGTLCFPLSKHFLGCCWWKTKGRVAVGYLLGAPHTRSAAGHGISELRQGWAIPINRDHDDHELIKYWNSCESRFRLGMATGFGALFDDPR